MKDLKKNSIYVIFGIAAVVYTVVFCLIPFHKSAASWVAFAFGLVALGGSCFIILIALDKGSDIKSKVYGLPILKLGYAYLISQMIVTLLVSISAMVVDTPVWIPLVISIVLIGIVAVGVIITDNTREIIEKQDEAVKIATKQVTMFKLDVSSIIDRCKDDEAKKELDKLSESLKYSDPVSNDELKESEQRIAEEINTLGKMIDSNEDGIIEKIKEIERLLEDRNRRCKALK